MLSGNHPTQVAVAKAARQPSARRGVARIGDAGRVQTWHAEQGLGHLCGHVHVTFAITSLKPGQRVRNL